MKTLTIVDDKIKLTILFPYFKYFAHEQVWLTYPLQVEFTIFSLGDATKIVVTACPNYIILITVDNSDTSDARVIEDVPRRMVIIHHAFEISEIDGAVGTCLKIEIDIMRIIFLRRIVFQERHALSRESHGLQQHQQRNQQSFHKRTPFLTSNKNDS